MPCCVLCAAQLIAQMCLALYKEVFAQTNIAVCHICQPRTSVLEYVNPNVYRMSIQHKYCFEIYATECLCSVKYVNILNGVVMFVARLPQLFSPSFWFCIKLPSGLLWRPGRHVDANLLVSWHRMAPAWREIHPLTPACHEIIEPCTVPDCMLSWCSPNLFHSLIRGFVCRKGTDWAVPGGMTSTFLLSCWCHKEFGWSDFAVSLYQFEDAATA